MTTLTNALLEADITAWDKWSLSDAEIEAAYLDPAQGDLQWDKAVDPSKLIEAIDATEFASAAAGARDWMRLVFGLRYINTRDGAVRTGLQAIFGVGSATRTAFIALCQVQMPRWEVNDWDRAPSPSDVARARTLHGG